MGALFNPAHAKVYNYEFRSDGSTKFGPSETNFLWNEVQIYVTLSFDTSKAEGDEEWITGWAKFFGAAEFEMPIVGTGNGFGFSTTWGGYGIYLDGSAEYAEYDETGRLIREIFSSHQFDFSFGGIPGGCDPEGRFCLPTNEYLSGIGTTWSYGTAVEKLYEYDSFGLPTVTTTTHDFFFNAGLTDFRLVSVISAPPSLPLILGGLVLLGCFSKVRANRDSSI